MLCILCMLCSTSRSLSSLKYLQGPGTLLSTPKSWNLVCRLLWYQLYDINTNILIRIIIIIIIIKNDDNNNDQNYDDNVVSRIIL